MIRLAIIGFGPRGLTVLERVSAHLRDAPVDVAVDIFDSGTSMGWGVHSPRLPDYLRLNTIAGQLTAYTDPAMVSPGAPVTPGPTFYEWVRRNGVTITEWGLTRTPGSADFLPRSVLGHYLSEAAERFTEHSGPRITVTVHRTPVTKVATNGACAQVTTITGRHDSDLLFIATGHGDNDAGPTPDTTHIKPARRVLLRGMGLTAMDMVADLTVGRGGRFSVAEEDTRTLVYAASGEEPQIVLASRSGQLPAARPHIDPTGPAHHSPHFAYGLTESLRRHLEHADDPRDAGREMIIEGLSEGLTVDERRRLARKLAEPCIWPDYQTYSGSVLSDAEWDVDQATAGISGSRYKSVVESLRTNREQFRIAVDHADPELRRKFFAATPDLINRLVIGPQKERIIELLALIKAGVVRLAPGPDPDVVRTHDTYQVISRWLRTPETVTVDEVVEARVTAPAPLIGTANTPPHLSGAQLLTETGPAPICIVGPPAEGTSYYNHYVPSPGVSSRAHRELDAVITRAFGPLLTRRPSVAASL
ncbi:FAD/NAD(P)-binding protein [Nocardia sp. NPDC051570]|uniref:FAD/NAD(P)-binding protein n=1 Tax=Nocardia sp. NPDC051570 TaxID=3364324 RepID=UPI003791EFD1